MSIVVSKTRLPVTEWQTESGSVVSVNNARRRDAKSAVVTLQPIQDLHGYSSPWVGGAGKNVLPLTNYFTSRFTVADDGTVSQNNKTSAPFAWSYENTVFRVKLPAGKYTLSEYITVATTSSSHNVRVISSDNSINIARNDCRSYGNISARRAVQGSIYGICLRRPYKYDSDRYHALYLYVQGAYIR